MQMGALVPFAGLFVKQRGGAADAKCAVKFFSEFCASPS
jgi:hypothetical protein